MNLNANTFANAAKAEKAASLTSGVPSLRHYITDKIYIEYEYDKQDLD